MRLLFVADGRSPIALNWIEYFLAEQHADRRDEVHLASTFPCTPDSRLASYQFIPLAFSNAKKGRTGAGPVGGDSGTAGQNTLPGRAVRCGLWSARLVGFRTRVRQALGPLTLPAAARQLRAYIDQVQPDLVHAMRIPFEGMLAAQAIGESKSPGPLPLLCSIWGNDFTLHARATPWMARLTRQTLQRADALHADCQRDVRLAATWGFAADRPSAVLPGAGGIQEEVFFPPADPVFAPVVIQPRGFRAYVDNETFFRSVTIVLRGRPETRFLCPTMAGDPQAQRWIDMLGIPAGAVDLLPQVPHSRMAELFRASRVIVSPATHDGTPNTLLEAMACGCFPVVGDLESLREWITPGANGLLVEQHNPQALAQAILLALEADGLICQARKENARLIVGRAAYRTVMAEARRFYTRILSR